MIKLKSKKTRMGIMLFLVPALVIYLVSFFKEHGKNGHHQCDLSYPDRTFDGSCDQYKV